MFGDGVNVAARLEGVARPGGVAVSRSVRDHVANKLDLVFEDMGEQQLKNIERPVRVYDVAARSAGATGRCRPTVRWPIAEEKPSIAVLPFTNMSGDPEQEYFSDGITEDIITDLSKVGALFVVGRHTSFAYKGKSAHLERIATELGVRFLLEGSVRKAGNRMRITGQLIDGATGGHLWAERYDRDLTDIFAIQDEITKAIVDQLKVRLLPEEKKVIGQAPTPNVEAYALYLKGREYLPQSDQSVAWARPADVRAGRPSSILPSPGLMPASPIAMRGSSAGTGCGFHSTKFSAMADKALALDPSLAEAHAARGEVLRIAGRSDEATAAFEQALALDPNSYEANLAYARHCRGAGRAGAGGRAVRPGAGGAAR